MAAATCAVVALALEALQVSQRLVAHDEHIAAAPAVAAVGTAARHVRFAAEAHAAVAAGSGLDVDPRAIVQHADHRDSRTDAIRRARARRDRRPAAARLAAALCAARSALLGVGQHADHATAPAAGELHGACGARVERVVFADADAGARLEAGAALAHDDLAAGDGLAGERLDAQPLGVGVATVAARAEPLLMSHLQSSPCPRRASRRAPGPPWL